MKELNINFGIRKRLPIVKLVCIMLCFSIGIIQPISISAAEASKSKSTSTSYKWPAGPKGSTLSADSAIVMEASTGLILYEKNIDKKHYPASITKILTTLVTLENSSLNEVVTYSKDAVYGIEPGSSHIAIDVGEQLTMEQSLYGIMLESANEACLGVAEHVAGSTSEFVKLMNKKAKELGCTNSHFANPNGLHNDDHYTTAHDMALIAQAAIKNETFRKITGTKSYTIPATNKKEARTWIKNHHQMLNGYKYPQYEYDYCIGGKTGYTTRAQSTLVTYAEKDGMTLICVVMEAAGAKVPVNQYTDTKKLLDFGFQKYATYNLTSQDSTTVTETIPLFDKYSSLFNKKQIPIYIDPNTKLVLPKDVDVSEAEKNVTYDSNVSIQKGENVIGTVTYTFAGKTVGQGNIIYNVQDAPSLITETAVSEVKNDKKLNPSKHNFKLRHYHIIIIVVLVLVLLYLLFVIRPRRKKRRYYSSRRRYR